MITRGRIICFYVFDIFKVTAISPSASNMVVLSSAPVSSFPPPVSLGVTVWLLLYSLPPFDSSLRNFYSFTCTCQPGLSGQPIYRPVPCSGMKLFRGYTLASQTPALHIWAFVFVICLAVRTTFRSLFTLQRVFVSFLSQQTGLVYVTERFQGSPLLFMYCIMYIYLLK